MIASYHFDLQRTLCQMTPTICHVRQFFIHRLRRTEENQRCRTCSRPVSQHSFVIAPVNLEEMMKLRQIKTLRKYSCPLCQFEEVFQLNLFAKAQKLL